MWLHCGWLQSYWKRQLYNEQLPYLNSVDGILELFDLLHDKIQSHKKKKKRIVPSAWAMEIGYEQIMAKLPPDCDRPALTLFGDVPTKTCINCSVIINGTMCHSLRWAMGATLLEALLLPSPISRSEWQLRVNTVLCNKAGMYQDTTDTFFCSLLLHQRVYCFISMFSQHCLKPSWFSTWNKIQTPRHSL